MTLFCTSILFGRAGRQDQALRDAGVSLNSDNSVLDKFSSVLDLSE